VTLQTEDKTVLHIYVRVSSAAQESKTSIDSQQELGAAKAKELGFSHKIWNEGGQSSSGEDLSNRPVLLALLEEIEQGDVKQVFVFNTDRLSRNETTWSLIRLKLVKHDVTLHTSSGVFSLANQMDKLLLTIMSEISTYDNYLRAERSRLGKFKRVRQGQWLGGPPPFGFSIEAKKLVPNPNEVKWVRKIFEAYRDRRTPREIKQILLANGVKTRRNNDVWSLGSIEKLLTNTHYGGYYYVKDGKTQDVIRVECPQILPSSLIQEVATAKLGRTRQTRVKESNQQSFFLLREFLFCTQCDSRYSGRIFPSQYKSVYYCPRMERNYVNEKRTTEKKCDNRRYLKIDATDSLVWDTVVEVLSKSHLFKEEVKRQVFGDTKSEALQREHVKELKRKHRKIQLEIKEVTTTLVNIETDRFLKRRNPDELARIIQNVESERQRLEAMRDELSNEVHILESQTKWVTWVAKFGERIEKMGDFTLTEKQLFLRGVIDKISVSTLDKQRHELSLHFKIPYVNDQLIWKDERYKSKGYTLVEGVSEVSIDIDSSKKSPSLKE
jgi:DNA invertase Pin-like site-specific DNA recombinase